MDTDTNETIQLSLATAGQLHLRRGNTPPTLVRPVLCFPMSRPSTHISLRDSEHEEIAFLAQLDTLDTESRQALEESLRSGSYTFEVVSIRDIRPDFELRVWEVETASGNRSFQTALDAWPRELDDGSHLIDDVHGDFYRIPPPDQLDEASAKKLWSLVG